MTLHKIWVYRWLYFWSIAFSTDSDFRYRNYFLNFASDQSCPTWPNQCTSAIRVSYECVYNMCSVSYTACTRTRASRTCTRTPIRLLVQLLMQKKYSKRWVNRKSESVENSIDRKYNQWCTQISGSVIEHLCNKSLHSRGRNTRSESIPTLYTQKLQVGFVGMRLDRAVSGVSSLSYSIVRFSLNNCKVWVEKSRPYINSYKTRTKLVTLVHQLTTIVPTLVVSRH